MTRSRSLFVTFLALAIANLVLVNSAGTAGAAANAAFLGPDAGSLALPILQSLTPAHSQYWLTGLSGNSPGGVSPSNCQVGQDNLVHFLPVPYGLDHDVTIECSVARNAPLLLDAGGWLVYEDPPECPGAFNKNDLKFFAAELAFGSGFGPTAVQSSAQLDGRPLPLTKLNVGPFDLSIGPGGPDECYQAYYNSVHLGHPGRLAHGYGGYKALVPGLTRGRHTVVSRIGFGGGAQHTVTYVITSR